MKKVLAIVVACMLLVSVFAVSAAAATPKEDIIAAAKAALLDQHHEEILPMIENVLAQVDVNADQAAQIIQHIKNAEAAVEKHEGDSLSEYSKAEQAAVLKEIKAAAAVLNLDTVIEESKNPVHEGDIVFDVYDATGKQVAAIDLDVKKTNTTTDYTMAVVAVLFVAVAAAAAVYGKKLVASR